MAHIADLRDLYVTIYGLRPASASLLNEMESKLGVLLPAEFREICQFYDGSGLHAIPMLSLGNNAPKENPLLETLRYRRAASLPATYLALAEPPESLIIMECSGSGKVLWIDAIDAERIASMDFARAPDVWASFSDFFQYLLEEAEMD
jgi:hypothetical protein